MAKAASIDISGLWNCLEPAGQMVENHRCARSLCDLMVAQLMPASKSIEEEQLARLRSSAGVEPENSFYAVPCIGKDLRERRTICCHTSAAGHGEIITVDPDPHEMRLLFRRYCVSRRAVTSGLNN